MGLFTIAGVLEGFYGQPWSWADRRAVMERCVPAGLPWFAWAPKNDPLHRDAWRDPFPDEHLEGFADLLAIDGLKLCVSIAPGKDVGDIDEDIASLSAKLEPVVQIVEANGSHIPLVLIAFDDLESEPGQLVADALRHAEIISALGNYFGSRIQLGAVPAHYAGVQPTQYLTAFSENLPPEVLIGWTGDAVVNDRISAESAERFADAVDGRALLLWDNYPVNDVFLRDRLFLHPLRGRDPLLSEFCPAYFANAAVQPMLSLPPLLSAAAWCETGTSVEAWDEFDEPAQLAMLAEACEGGELYRLAIAAVDEPDSKEFDDLWWWLERMEVLELTGEMGDQAKAWTDQANTEAEVALIAMDLLERDPGDVEVPALVIDLWTRWGKVRRAKHSVFGPRFAVTPTMGVSAAGVWTLVGSSVREDANATDVLCRAGLARHQAE
jgi:hypothetical protein